MAQAVAPDEVVGWWRRRPDLVHRLERGSLGIDPTLRRLNADDIDVQPDLRRLCEGAQVKPENVLAYTAQAEGLYGLYRLVALFPLPPSHNPMVLCLDGPRGQGASPHRNSDIELCLYYPNDPLGQRWTLGRGLLALFDIGRRHVLAEHFWREGGRVAWPLDEAPHGHPPATIELAPEPERNAPCSCGSGRKWKACCMVSSR